MYLKALIVLCIIGVILAVTNLLYLFLQKRKYKILHNKQRKNSKTNAKSMRDINNDIKANFIKTILRTKTMQVMLIIDGCFFTTILVLIGVFIWM